MRKALTSFIALAAGLALAACGDPKPAETGPESLAADTAAVEQSAVMPEDAPPQEEAMSEADSPATNYASGEDAPGPCSDTLGNAQAASLVRRCIVVSPATHPPCNAANPCAMIQDEIDRSCAMYGPGEDKPAECAS